MRASAVVLTAFLLGAPAASADKGAPRIFPYERSLAQHLIENDGPAAFLFVDGPLAAAQHDAIARLLQERTYRHASVVVVDLARDREFAATWNAPAAPSLIMHRADDYVRWIAGPIDADVLRREFDRALAAPVSRANRRNGGGD